MILIPKFNLSEVANLERLGNRIFGSWEGELRNFRTLENGDLKVPIVSTTTRVGYEDGCDWTSHNFVPRKIRIRRTGEKERRRVGC